MRLKLKEVISYQCMCPRGNQCGKIIDFALTQMCQTDCLPNFKISDIGSRHRRVKLEVELIQSAFCVERCQSSLTVILYYPCCLPNIDIQTVRVGMGV